MKRGDIVAVTFSDHVQNGMEAIDFIVYGKVLHQTRRTVTIGSWVYADGGDKSHTDGNEEIFTIVKSTIRDAVVLQGKGAA